MLDRRSLLGMGLGLAVRRGLRTAVFSADVTPPLATPLCYGLVPEGAATGDRLQARGIVLLPEGQSAVVLCAVDWLGIGNGSRDRWRAALAKACGTVPDRVSVHTVHQHDAPGDDTTAQSLLPTGVPPLSDDAFAGAAVQRVAQAARRARAVRITHVGTGAARVERIASNRRILDDGGKVVFGRMTACRNSPHCAAPEGVIDPMLRSISFFDGEKRVATLSYYATHPMSHYGKGVISADFVGMARDRQSDTFQIHFTGAAGNIGAGKYNDGSAEMRPVLAERLARAMVQAKAAEVRQPYDGLDWRTAAVSLPLRTGSGFSEQEITAGLQDPRADPKLRRNNARYLAFYRLSRAGRQMDLSSLRIGGARTLHLPGEAFVEYQLAAGVATAAYGDYGPMYIGTQRSYDEGGYETTAVSRVGPGAEEVLLRAIHLLTPPA